MDTRKLEIVQNAINTPEKYEIAIDIHENIKEIMRPLVIEFFDATKEKVQERFKLDPEKWVFFYEPEDVFSFFKRSWQLDKSQRGIYSLALWSGDKSGIVRINWHDPSDLVEEEQAIIAIIRDWKEGGHKYQQNDGWWLLGKKPNPFAWKEKEYYRKISNPERETFKSLVEECVDRMDDILTLMKETDIEKAIDEAVELRKKNNKIE